MHRDHKQTQKHDALRQRNYRLERQQIKDRQREYLAKCMHIYREKTEEHKK